jgi:hypothetical protein
MAITGLRRLTEHPTFLNFYQEMSVRVAFYGDYERHLAGTPYADLIDRFAAITEQTRGNGPYRLFFGLFAHDPSERIAQIGIDYHAAQGKAPDRRALIEAYYGEPIAPLSFFIGFDRFSFFDVPLLATGMEDLYFTVSPSLYLTERGLRAILYDHLFARRVEETDYQDMSTADFDLMRRFYHANRDRTLGVGRVQERGRYWYPLPGVQLTEGFADEGDGQ